MPEDVKFKLRVIAYLAVGLLTMTAVKMWETSTLEGIVRDNQIQDSYCLLRHVEREQMILKDRIDRLNWQEPLSQP